MGSLLGSDLQVVCVWCVVSLFVFFWGGGFPLSVCLPYTIPPPPKKKGEKQCSLIIIGCVALFFTGVSLATPRGAPPLPK